MRLILLSDKFYEEYGNFPEILQKSTRPYVCLEIIIMGKTYAIPFRHHIAHKYAFFTVGESGLDYTKAILVLDNSYISLETPRVEQAEYNAIKGSEPVIATGMRNYIKLYKKAVEYRTNKHYANILKYSTLRYFEKYL